MVFSGGSTINQLQSLTGARIQVSQHDIIDNERVITLIGTVHAIERANIEIYKVIANFESGVTVPKLDGFDTLKPFDPNAQNADSEPMKDGESPEKFL